MVNPFPDLSNYQSGSNVAQILAALGSDRALYKATEGLSYKASTFPAFVATTTALGKKVGAYHFAKPSQSSGTSEASWHASVIRVAGFSPSNLGNHWSCYDFEDPALDQSVASNRSKAQAHAINFTNAMAALGWTQGVVYGSYPYLNWAGLTAAMLPQGWRQLHIANYGQQSDTTVTLPNGWSRTQVVARQYTSTATVPGASTRIDVSHFVREWLGEGAAQAMGAADDQIGALSGAINGVNPSDFSHQFAALYWMANKLVNDPHLGTATQDQAGAIGLNVAAARADIAALAKAIQAGGGGTVPAPTIDYDLLAGKVVDALAARLMAQHVAAPMTAQEHDQERLRQMQRARVSGDESVYSQLTREWDATHPRTVLAPKQPTTPPPGEVRHEDGMPCPNVITCPRLKGGADFVCGCQPGVDIPE